jgi:hypothetical protein
MTQQSGTPQPSTDLADEDEQRYTSKYLGQIADLEFKSDRDISEYAKFYQTNPLAGYAFYKLKKVFEKIDRIIDIKSPKGSVSHWDYFSDVESLAAFSTKITQLTETLQGSSEPLIVETIRIVDRSGMRRKMFKRIINLEPSERTFESDILEHLEDRHKILDGFLTAVYVERSRRKARRYLDEGSV